ncbi:hypothetical protein ACHAP8_010538 [Fusarium lateritium]
MFSEGREVLGLAGAPARLTGADLRQDAKTSKRNHETGVEALNPGFLCLIKVHRGLCTGQSIVELDMLAIDSDA